MDFKRKKKTSKCQSFLLLLYYPYFLFTVRTAFKLVHVFRNPPVRIICVMIFWTDSTLTLQRLNHVGFLYIFTSKYTRKHIRLMSFYKTFTTKDTIASINDSIRLVSKPFIYSIFKLLYYLNFSFQLIYLLPNYEVDRNYQIFHYIYQYQNFLNHRLYSLSRKRNTYPFVF